ncbi:hypothetical protein Tco_0521145 [Tanacetum coccineum]
MESYPGLLATPPTITRSSVSALNMLDQDLAQIRRIFLDGYDVLVVRIVIFKISSFKLQNARLLLIFTKYSVITTLFDVIKEFEAEASAGGTMEIVVDPLATGGISESTGGDAPDLEGTLYDISHYMSEVPLDRITEFETAQRQLEAGRENLRVRALFCIERDRVDSLRRHITLSQEEFCQVRTNHDDTRRRLRRLESLVERRLGFRQATEELVNQRVEEALAAYEATHAANALEAISARPVARECTYPNFMKCQPLNFKGTEGVVGLIRWFEKMETVIHIRNCPKKYQVKYATCTLLNSALTWWNSHKRTIRTDAAFSMSWRELMKLMVEVYCPRNEIQKMESEL